MKTKKDEYNFIIHYKYFENYLEFYVFSNQKNENYNFITFT